MVNANLTAAAHGDRLDGRIGRLANPAWFVDLGVVLLLLGTVASVDLLFAQVAPTRDVGLLMIIAGAAQVACALRVEASGRVLPWVVSGVLFALAGALASWTSLLASPAVAPLASLALASAGAARLLAWLELRSEEGSSWVLAAGLVTVLAGPVALAGWLLDAPGVACLVLVADLTFQGLAWLALGLEIDRPEDESHLADAAGRAGA